MTPFNKWKWKPKIVRIPEDMMIVDPDDRMVRQGAYSIIGSNKSILSGYPDIPNLCLKIFDKPMIGSIYDYQWGSTFPETKAAHRSKLIDAARCQNIIAWYGLAPRVFDIILIPFNEGFYPALVTEYLEGPTDAPYDRFKTYLRIENLCSTLGITPCFPDFVGDNSFSKKWVDFQGFSFKEDYEERLKQRAQKTLLWSNNFYQSIEELRLDGFRKTPQRIGDLRLNDLEIEGKTFLDVGCSGGAFCNFLKRKGATTVVGVDIPSIAETAHEISTYLGYFGIEYIGADLTLARWVETHTPKYKPFDTVLYLSMYRHIGYPDYIDQLVKHLLIFETNGDKPDEEIETMLQNKFKEVKIVGAATEFDNRLIYWCTR